MDDVQIKGVRLVAVADDAPLGAAAAPLDAPPKDVAAPSPPPKRLHTSAGASGGLRRMPGDLVVRVAEFIDTPTALALYLGCGEKGARLKAAFKDARDLKRAARLRHASDEEIFGRWERLPNSLRGVVVDMPEHLFERLFRGAALRGVEALSKLDASRVDIDRLRATYGKTNAELQREMKRELMKNMDLVPEQARQWAEENLEQIIPACDMTQPSFRFDQAIVTLVLDDELADAVGRGAPAWSWLCRHALLPMPPLAAEMMFEHPFPAYLLFADFCMHLLQSRSPDPDRAPQFGGPDFAAHYGRARRGEGRAETTWRCFEFFDRMDMLASELDMFLGGVGGIAFITDEGALAANVRLQERFSEQRRWLLGVDEDRLAVRAALARGEAAHRAFLAEKYATNPLE